VDCEQALPLISARLDGELPEGDAAALDGHLTACPGCRAAAESFRLQDADLRRAFAPRRQAAARVAERVIGHLYDAPAPRPPRRLPWLPMLLSAAAGFLLAVAVFRPWQQPPPATTPDDQARAHPPQPRPTLLLALATGAVEVLAPGQETWQPLTAGGTVEVGCQVRTPAQVRCEFRCPDGTEVRLNSETELRFRTARDLALSRGQILAKVIKDPVPFQVDVASARVTALGTEFDLWARPQETRLAVLEGSTRVRARGEDTLVQTRELATIVNGRVEKQRGESLLQATDWVEELLRLKGGMNDELARRIDERVNDILAQIGHTKESTLTDEQIRSLGSHCVVPLTKFIESDRSRVRGQEDKRRRAARLIADLAQPWHIPDLIDLLADDDREVRYYAAKGLTRLVPDREPLPPEGWRDDPRPRREKAVKDWRAWWDKSKGRYPQVR
jgi:ferric-dicitrate binding protein FerR (iron transport regulator)